MAIERVTVKSKRFHITALSNDYFDFVENLKPVRKIKDNSILQICFVIAIAFIPAGLLFLIVSEIPGFFIFITHLIVLWVCLGCPVTRNTYRRYIQSANREDFEACSLYSEKLGVEDGELSAVGKQLVLVNYRQYASVIIFYVFLGVAGVVFYSLVKEWFLRRQKALRLAQDETTVIEHVTNEQDTIVIDEVEQPINKTHDDQETVIETTKQTSIFNISIAKRVLYVLDWLPVRMTALGFLLVGHFSRGLPAYLSVLLDFKKSTYQVLSKVAKASEEPEPFVKPVLQEPLQMVKLVKRNIVFLLVAISIMTLIGFLG